MYAVVLSRHVPLNFPVFRVCGKNLISASDLRWAEIPIMSYRTLKRIWQGHCMRLFPSRTLFLPTTLFFEGVSPSILLLIGGLPLVMVPFNADVENMKLPDLCFNMNSLIVRKAFS